MMNPRVIVLIVLFLSLRLSAAEVEVGRLLERVACVSDPGQTYALYVPSRYTPARTWPVIYCFDPGARGRTAVERLQAAAEKYGYIVAGSNVSRNGPWENNLKAIAAMTRDVASRFSTDKRRVYSTGMSGGARVAMELGLEGYAQGVIACSAGFPGEIPASVTFPIFGTAGVEDMNYYEMKVLDRRLSEMKAPHRVVIFEGGHEWASVALLTEGVEWLEVQAMKAGTRVKDSALIEELFAKRWAAVPVGAGFNRWRELSSLAADFRGLRALGDIERELAGLGATPEIKAAIKAERVAEDDELALHQRLEDLSGAKPAAKEKAVAELLARSGVSEATPDRQMVRRRLAAFQANLRENVTWLFDNQRYREAANVLELSAMLRPGQSRTLFDLARARAFAKDGKRALEALRESAAAGFSDAARAEAEPAFAKIKGEAEFAEILAAMRKNPPEPAGRGRGRF